MDDAVDIRAVTDADRDQVMALAARSLGWVADQRDRDFFSWKHDQNPFGSSYALGAFDRDRLIGFRTMLRWRFERSGQHLSMVRAVDTATDPDHQGRGVFRALTTRAVEDLTAEGIDAVYNTPNEKSRPGYLKMGWRSLGRPSLGMHPRTPIVLAHMVRARVAAQKWSEPVTTGEPISAVIHQCGDRYAVPTRRWATPRTASYLRWRYGFEPLCYRAVEVRGGYCVFRVRLRGGLREVAICEWLADRPDIGALHRLVRSCGDYAVGVGGTIGGGFLPLPRQGPVLTWRDMARSRIPELDQLHLGLGDLELF